MMVVGDSSAAISTFDAPRADRRITLCFGPTSGKALLSGVCKRARMCKRGKTTTDFLFRSARFASLSRAWMCARLERALT